MLASAQALRADAAVERWLLRRSARGGAMRGSEAFCPKWVTIFCRSSVGRAARVSWATFFLPRYRCLGASIPHLVELTLNVSVNLAASGQAPEERAVAAAMAPRSVAVHELAAGQ